MNYGLPLFDGIEAQRHAAEGIALAASHNGSLVHEAREIAVEHCLCFGVVTMNDVQAELVRRGHSVHALGNAAGAVFRDARFVWTGNYVKSTRIHGHGNLIREWRLAQ